MHVDYTLFLHWDRMVKKPGKKHSPVASNQQPMPFVSLIAAGLSVFLWSALLVMPLGEEWQHLLCRETHTRATELTQGVSYIGLLLLWLKYQGQRQLRAPDHSLSPKAMRTRAQAAWEPGGRSRCRGHRGVLLIGLLPLAFSAFLIKLRTTSRGCLYPQWACLQPNVMGAFSQLQFSLLRWL